MVILLEYSKNYYLTSESLWNYYGDEINEDVNGNDNDNNDNNNSNNTNRINNNKIMSIRQNKQEACQTIIIRLT